jgi:hypothetical protein
MKKPTYKNFLNNLFSRFVEAFSIFCGMAIRNAADYEKAVVSEAKLQVAFEVMNRYQISRVLVSLTDMLHLCFLSMW